eukprot:scaffold2477_cov285-Chaetoceros_neogracile.AAC.5
MLIKLLLLMDLMLKLKLMNLDGTYQTARSIAKYAHIVTSSTLDLSSTLNQILNPFTEEEFADMNVAEYRYATHEILMGSPDHTGDSKGLVALMLKAAQELNKILHPIYHHSLRILYSRH